MPVPVAVVGVGVVGVEVAAVEAPDLATGLASPVLNHGPAGDGVPLVLRGPVHLLQLAAAARGDLQEITAPMVGTFYRSSAPGEPPFVEIGSRIKAGQTVCILDAMKLMNELEADMGGEVVDILVENGTPVEFAQVLMRIKPG